MCTFTFHTSHFTFQVCYIRGAATVSNQIHLSLSPVNMSGASSGFYPNVSLAVLHRNCGVMGYLLGALQAYAWLLAILDSSYLLPLVFPSNLPFWE